jgi:hypothetical protein
VSRVDYVEFESHYPSLFLIAVGPYEAVRHEVHVRVQNDQVVQIRVIWSNED